jgi:hypothetical protein
MLSSREFRSNSEQGSVMITVVIVALLSLVAATLFTSVNTGLSSARTDQDRTDAFQRANAGIDQVLYRLDRNDLPALTDTNADGVGDTFTEVLNQTDAEGGLRYQITATQDPPNQTARWTVRSIGIDSRDDTDGLQRRRQAVATIQAQLLFQDGFFTFNDFTLTGNQDSPEAFKWTPSGINALTTFPIPSNIGTNATISGATATVEAFKAKWRGFNMYGRPTQAAADEACASGGCGTSPKVKAITDQIPVLTPPIPPGAAACPFGGIIGVDGGTTTIAPGDYTCSDLTFRGRVIISGTGLARFWPTRTLFFAPGSITNDDAGNLDLYGGNPKRFQVFFGVSSNCTGLSGADLTTCVGNTAGICDAEVWGLLYTPGLSIACNGSHQPEMWGAVVANLHGGTGNHFDFHWDAESAFAVHTGKYRIYNWRECPADATSC